jgi:hypothetical protein
VPGDDIDALRLSEQHLHVALPSQYPANRRGNIAWRQRRGGDLIQERLKKMVVMAVDQRDANRRAGESSRGVQPAEPAANNDYVGSARVLVATTSRGRDSRDT